MLQSNLSQFPTTEQVPTTREQITQAELALVLSLRTRTVSLFVA